MMMLSLNCCCFCDFVMLWLSSSGLFCCYTIETVHFVFFIFLFILFVIILFFVMHYFMINLVVFILCFLV